MFLSPLFFSCFPQGPGQDRDHGPGAPEQDPEQCPSDAHPNATDAWQDGSRLSQH